MRLVSRIQGEKSLFDKEKKKVRSKEISWKVIDLMPIESVLLYYRIG